MNHKEGQFAPEDSLELQGRDKLSSGQRQEKSLREKSKSLTKKERLAQELRRNLNRRKVQARGRAAAHEDKAPLPATDDDQNTSC